MRIQHKWQKGPHPSPNSHSTRDWEDILCDRCGKSCRDDMDMNFEHARMDTYWGYASKKDLYRHEIDLCELCYDEVIKVMGIKPKVSTYL